eukprot:TRINITY_DN6943_c1_g5_i1.p1 TRINITY_DN6943_c1_g5~~TRINITY_DN6943_c1_g5_i1.p1  ORF type:complete len:422 (-),score=41.59 TRINITY_DN6943_c1_g5_i1:147-1412(-)
MPKLLQPVPGQEGQGDRRIQFPVDPELLRLPPIQPDRKSPQEGATGEDRNTPGNTPLAISNVVASTTTDGDGGPPATRPTQPNPTYPDTKLDAPVLESIADSLLEEGFSSEAVNLITKRFAADTHHNSRWKAWVSWCKTAKAEPFVPSDVSLTNYVSALHNSGKAASTIKSYKVAVVNVWNIVADATADQFPKLKHTLREITVDRPSRPKYDETWNIHILENYIINWKRDDKNQKKTSEYYRDKLIMLFSIQCLKRSDDLAKLTLGSFDHKDHKFKIFNMKNCKNAWSPWFYYAPNDSKPELCIVRAIDRYMRWFKLGSRDPQEPFFRSLSNHKLPIQSSTIANIRSRIMQEANIPEKFTSHSIRMAAASALIDQGMDIEEVMAIGGWSSKRVFLVFYNRSNKSKRKQWYQRRVRGIQRWC